MIVFILWFDKVGTCATLSNHMVMFIGLKRKEVVSYPAF